MSYVICYSTEEEYVPLVVVHGLNAAINYVKEHSSQLFYPEYYLFGLESPVRCQFLDGKILCS